MSELDKSGVYEDMSGEPTPNKKQVRAWEVRIDNPLNEDPTLLYRTEKVVLDENDKLIYREDRRKTKDVSRKFSEVALNSTTFKDPVTQQEVTLSGAGIAEAISIFFAKMWKEEI
jgi:hypothetical protein